MCYAEEKGCKWIDDAQEAFAHIKELIAANPAVTMFDPILPTFVTKDACDYGIGAVLTQLYTESLKRLLRLHTGPLLIEKESTQS